MGFSAWNTRLDYSILIHISFFLASIGTGTSEEIKPALRSGSQQTKGQYQAKCFPTHWPNPTLFSFVSPSLRAVDHQRVLSYPGMPSSALVNSGTPSHKPHKKTNPKAKREVASSQVEDRSAYIHPEKQTWKFKENERIQCEILSKEEEIKCWLRQVLSTNNDFALPAVRMTTRNNWPVENEKRVVVKRYSPTELPRKKKRARLDLTNNQVRPNSRTQTSPPHYASLKTKPMTRDTSVKHRPLNNAITCK